MRFVISTHFYNAVYNVEQRLEIKTNELQKAFETCRAFVIGSKSCRISIFENENRTKTPNYGTILNIRDASYVGGILTNETKFNNWVLNLKKGANNV